MSDQPPTPSRVRRMLPSVSEVLKELTVRASVEPEVAFRAAREVCAEELKRIRDAGGDSVPLEELVRRAYFRVTGGTLPGVAAPPTPAPPPGPVFEIADESPFAAGPPEEEGREADDPFRETTGALDLVWEGGREPFGGEPTAPGVPAEPSPTEVLPALFARPGEPEPFPVAAGAAPAEMPTVELPREGTGPGDETLTRLSREAQAMDLHEVFSPRGSAEPGDVDPRHAGLRGEGPAPPETPAPFEDDEDTVLTVPRGGRRAGGGPRFGLLIGVAAGLAALVGLGYVLVGLWVERDAVPATVAVARPRTTPTTSEPPPASGVVAPAGVRGEPAAAPASADAATPVPAATAMPQVAPPVATAAPPVRGTPPPAVKAPPPPAPVVAMTPEPAAAVVPRSRDGIVVTRDRAGQPQVFSIHFTSYKDRASAERDLARIEGLVGREGYVAEVDLGEKGTWQRVMIGEFPTAAEAKALREELLAKGTRDMGWVYRVVGPEGR